MAETAVAEDKAPIAAAAGVPMKMVIILVAGTLLLSLGGAFALIKLMGGRGAEEHKTEAAPAKVEGHGDAEAKAAGHVAGPGAIFDLEPFIVNLADSPEIRYLKLTVKLELDSREVSADLAARVPQLRDTILVLLTSKDSATIRTPQGKFQLRDEITQRVNSLLPKPGVRSAYFTDFVVQ